MSHLDWMVRDIAGQQRLLAAGRDQNAHVAGAVSRRCDQGDLVAFSA